MLQLGQQLISGGTLEAFDSGVGPVRVMTRVVAVLAYAIVVVEFELGVVAEFGLAGRVSETVSEF